MEEGVITAEESEAVAKVMEKIKDAEKGKRRRRRKAKGPQEGRSNVTTPTNPEGSRTEAAQQSPSQTTTTKENPPSKEEPNGTSSKNPGDETLYFEPDEVIDWVAVEVPTAPAVQTVAYKPAAQVAFQTAVECHTPPCNINTIAEFSQEELETAASALENLSDDDMKDIIDKM